MVAILLSGEDTAIMLPLQPHNVEFIELFPKNPEISKVFRDFGLGNELGSGIRNTYKFTELYSGGVPPFIEGDVLKTGIPLNENATMKSGQKSSGQVSD